MFSRTTPTALTALLGLALALASAKAFYMPPAFDAAAAVSGLSDTASRTASVANASTAYSASETGGAGTFDFGNRTETQAVTRSAGNGYGQAVAAGPSETGSSSPGEGEGQGRLAFGERDVWSPPITMPDAGTVWTVGHMVEVKWDVSHPPNHATNPKGRLVLGYFEDGDESNEHLDYQNPLATGFDLTKGYVNIKVPDVTPSNDYIVILFGDSGNHSPKFTITN